MTDDVYVGYYYGGIKLFSLVFGIVDSLTAILLPRFSNLMAEGRDEEFATISQKVYLLVNMLYLFWVVIVLYHL